MDLDGTAVKDDYSMCQSSILAIQKAQKHGHVVCFVTGRRDVDMLSLGEEQYCVDYHILNNGGKIVHCKDKKVIVNKTIDNNASRQLIEYALNNNLQIHIVDGMTWQVSKMTKGTLDYASTLGVIPEANISSTAKPQPQSSGFVKSDVQSITSSTNYSDYTGNESDEDLDNLPDFGSVVKEVTKVDNSSFRDDSPMKEMGAQDAEAMAQAIRTILNKDG